MCFRNKHWTLTLLFLERRKVRSLLSLLNPLGVNQRAWTPSFSPSNFITRDFNHAPTFDAFVSVLWFVLLVSVVHHKLLLRSNFLSQINEVLFYLSNQEINHQTENCRLIENSDSSQILRRVSSWWWKHSPVIPALLWSLKRSPSPVRHLCLLTATPSSWGRENTGTHLNK